MRHSTIWAAALAILIASSPAVMAEPDPQAPRASVVAIMKDAGQALLWSGDQGEYVVVRQGDRFGAFVVSAIQADQVVLTRAGTKDHFILPRTSDTSDLGFDKGARRPPSDTSLGLSPYPSGGRVRNTELLDPYPEPTSVAAPKTKTKTKTKAQTQVEAPSAAGIGDLSMLDPYGTTVPVKSVSAPRKKPVQAPAPGRKTTTTSDLGAPLDPYGASKPSSAIDPGMPLDPYGSGAASSTSPSGDLGAPLDPYGASKAATTKSAKAEPSASKPGKTRTERHRISRREFDEAVADFHALSETVQFSIVPEGVRVDGIKSDSLFYRWGFRSGDVVMSVDQKPIRGVDDAAAVYAHLMGTKKFTVAVQRGADTVTMNFRFKK